MSKSTRQQIKAKLESMVSNLQKLEITAVEIGMITDESDSEVAGVMFVVSKMVEVCIPLIEKANQEL